MSDQQQPARYPGFPITDEGLQKTHQALGMYVHHCLELEAARARDRLQQQQQMDVLVARLEALENGAPGEALSGPVPITGKPTRAASGG